MRHPLDHLKNPSRFDWRIADEWVVVFAFAGGIAVIALYTIARFL